MVEDVPPDSMATLRTLLDAMELGAGLEDMYWLPVPEEMLSPVQAQHQKSCGPHVLGLELDGSSVRLELLVRARGRLRCECVHFAAAPLRERMINYVDELLERRSTDD